MLLYPDATRKFVQESGKLRTPASRRTYVHNLRALQNLFPRTPVHRFDEQQLTQFCLMVKDDGTSPSPATVKIRRTVVTSAFGWFQWAKLISTTPAAALKYNIRPGNNGVRHHHWLSEAQVGEVFSSIDQTTWVGRRSLLCVMPGFLNGLRLHEITKLRWSMFSSDLSEVELVGKGEKPVTVAVAPQWAALLRPWREECKRYQTGDGSPLPRTHQSWGEIVTAWDKPLGEQGVYRIVCAVSEKCGLEFGPHDMRRSFAGMLQARGVPIEDISAALRHENIATTQRYLEKNPARAHKVTSGFTIAY